MTATKESIKFQEPNSKVLLDLGSWFLVFSRAATCRKKMSTMKHVSSLLVAMAILSEARPKVKPNIPYADPAHERQVLDVYSPHHAKDLPVVFWIHRRGWQTAD